MTISVYKKHPAKAVAGCTGLFSLAWVLREQFLHRSPLVHELDGPAERAHVFLARVDLERLVERAEQVGHGDSVVLDVGAVAAGAAEHLASLDAGASEGHAESPRIV